MGLTTPSSPREGTDWGCADVPRASAPEVTDALHSQLRVELGKQKRANEELTRKACELEIDVLQRDAELLTTLSQPGKASVARSTCSAVVIAPRVEQPPSDPCDYHSSSDASDEDAPPWSLRSGSDPPYHAKSSQSVSHVELARVVETDLRRHSAVSRCSSSQQLLAVAAALHSK